MKHLLSSTAFLVLNKELARQVGLKEAVLLADLISKEEYFIANGMTDGWFFNTAKNIEQDTCLTTHQQSRAIKRLEDLGILETKVVGIPAKKHFKIIENKLLSYFNTSFKESDKQVFKKGKTINKNKEIRITNKYFNKPTILEVKNYCILRKNNIDPEAFISFYESKGWMIGKNKMKDWKQAVITWEKRNYKKPTMSKIDAQLNEYLKGKEYL